MHSRFSAKCPKATGRIGNIRPGCFSDNKTAEMLQFFLQWRKMFRGINGSGTNHHFRFPVQNRTYQLPNIFSTILVVRIRVDNNIRPLTQRRIQSRHKPSGEPFVLRKTHDMMYAPLPGHFHRIVPAPVVDNQIFDFINPVDMPGQVI